MTVKHSNGEVIEFADRDWAAQYFALVDYIPDNALFDPTETKLDDFTRPGECDRLRSLVAERDARRSDILMQAAPGWSPFRPVLNAAGVKIGKVPSPELIEWIGLVREHLDSVIYRWKFHFKRPRPSRNCNGLTPMDPFERLPWRPDHPAYPSGHATTAWTHALLLAEVRRDRTQALHDAAADIALNREVAGLHFQSDSEAGKALAEQVSRLLLNSKERGADRFMALLHDL